MKHSFKFALGFCLLLGLRCGVAAQTYQLTDLGALLSHNSYAHGINNQGQVVGYWETTNGFRAFLYSGGLMTDLGALGGTNAFALSINNPGQVVGFAEAQDGVQAFLFDAGGMTRLGTLGGLNSYAFGINYHAEIVGYIDTTEGARAFLYSGGSVTNLGTLGGTNSYAYGVNILAQVAGASATDGQTATHAFLWQNGLLINLNNLVPEDFGWELQEARGINDAGQIVGSGMIQGQEHGFLYGSGGLIDLGVLPGGTNSFALGLNNSNQVVGASTTSNGVVHALLWQNGALTDLNSLLPAGSGWELREARGINDSGQIVGWGISNGREQAFLLTPPTAEFGQPIARTRTRLQSFQANGGESPPSVTITNPVNNATFASPTNITIYAQASDSDGTVTKVEFFGDLTKLGEDTAAPFSLTWTNPLTGSYTLTAKATDDSGLTAGSAPVDVSVHIAAGANIALNKAVIQSSTAYGGLAGRAVDGNTNGNWSASSVTGTDYQTQPWWQVDCGSVSGIDIIKIWNRTDCCAVRLSNFYVLVSDDPFQSTSLSVVTNQTGVSSYFTSGAAGTLTTISVNRTGRYVRVQLTGTDYLSLAEVQVWSSGPSAPPASPSNLTVKAMTSSQASLSWQLNSTDESAVKVERKMGADGTYQLVAVLPARSTYWIDGALSGGTTNYYRVRAGNNGGYSGYSNEASVVTPVGVAAIPLTNVVIWLKADSITGLTNGQPAPIWMDTSGAGNNASQGTTANQPQYYTNVINGNPVVHFDGVNDYFSLPNLFNGATQAEAFVVLKATADTPTATRSLWIFGSYNYFGNWYGKYPATDGTISEDFGTTGLNNIGNPTQPLDQFHLYNVAGKSGEWTARINGVVQYATTNNTFGYAASPKLGFGASYFAGDLSEVLIFNRTLTGDERDAVNIFLNSKYALVTSAPLAPTNLTATAISSSQVNLTWNSSLGTASTVFKLERKTGTGGTYAQIAVLRDATTYLDTNLAASTTYYYRVKASNFAGDSDFSNEANATTTGGGADLPLSNLKLWLKADAGVTRQGTNNSVEFWFDQSGTYNDASQQTAVNQPQWVDNAMNGRPVVRFDANSRYFNLPNLLNGATQAEAFVVLKATADTPTATRGLWIFGSSNYFGNWYGKYPATDGAISEDFGSTSLYGIGNPTQPLDQFHVYNVAGKTGEWTARINGVVQYTTPNNTFGYTSTPKLGFGTSYFAGDVAEVLIYSQTLTGDERDGVNSYLNSKYALVTSAPAAPTNLVASAISASQVSLSWDFALGNNSTSFKIERKTGSGGAYSQIAVVRDATSYLDSSLAAGTQYYYRVRANNSAGDSIYSNEANATTAAGAADLPLDMKLWVRADAGVVKQSNGSTVATWLDQSSSANHLTQTTPASQPTLIASAANSRPAIRFDAVNDYFNVPNLLNGATQAEVFVVLKASADVPGSARGLWNFGSYNYYGYVYGTYPATDGTITEDFGSTTLYNIGNPATPLDQYHLYDVFGKSGEWTARINGIVQFTTNYNAFGYTSSPKLGVGQNYFAGDVAELLIYLRTLSGAERQTIGYYLNQKYNLTTSIPATPSNLKSAGVSSTKLNLTWSRVSTNETSFAVERRVNTNGTWTFVGAANGNATNYLDQTGAPDVNYSYRVSANTYFTQSQPSSEITPPTVTVTSPTNGAALSSYVFAMGASALSNSLVTQIEFFSGARLLGATNTSPATLIQNDFLAGTASFSARATDSLGNSRFSPTVTATVFEDSDGDGLSNEYEISIGTDPTRADTDGDGVPDAQDAFPLDPGRSALPSSDPNDHTAPVITLEEPASATLLL